MTNYFSRCKVEFDGVASNNADPNYQVSWKKSTKPDEGDLDYLQFERKGDENMNITVCLTREESPERFRLSQALANTLDM